MNKIFDGDQVSALQNCLLDHGETVDAISEALVKFGYITSINRTEALMFVYQELMKSNYLILNSIIFILIYNLIIQSSFIISHYL